MSQLPANQYPLDSPNFHAYERCLDLEGTAGNASHEGSGPKFTLQTCGRILGYMMREAPSPDGCDNVRREIESCTTEKALSDLARLYAAHFFRIFKKAKGRTPATSFHPSRESFDDTRDLIQILLKEAPKSRSAVKNLALKRDNYCCVVTGVYDLRTLQNRRKTNPDFLPPVPYRLTEVAHIFPDSLNQDLTESDGSPTKKADYSATAWAVVERFGQVNVLTESLNGPDIHRVENVLTMCEGVHGLFDSLQLWFEATDVPHTYTTRSNDELNFHSVDPPVPPQVTFTSTDPAIPLPNPQYLRIHAACAKIAHLSGAAEYLETVLDECRETSVLASDGGSADLLSFMLAKAMVAVH